jgi:hypothetical protein
MPLSRQSFPLRHARPITIRTTAAVKRQSVSVKQPRASVIAAKWTLQHGPRTAAFGGKANTANG